MNKLLIVARQYDDYRKLLAQAQLPALEITEDPAQASIILADPPRIAAYLERYPALRWLQSTYAGIDALIQPDIRQDYTLTNIRGHFGQLIAEYVMGYTLDHTRQLSLYRQQQSQAQWRRFPYSPLDKRTMVILAPAPSGLIWHVLPKPLALKSSVLTVQARQEKLASTEFTPSPSWLKG